MEGFGAGYIGGHTVPILYFLVAHSTPHMYPICTQSHNFAVYVYYICSHLGRLQSGNKYVEHYKFIVFHVEGIIQEGRPQYKDLGLERMHTTRDLEGTPQLSA